MIFGAGPGTVPPDYSQVDAWLTASGALLASWAFLMARNDDPMKRRRTWYTAFGGGSLIVLAAVAAALDWF